MSLRYQCRRKVRYPTQTVAWDFALVLGLQHEKRFNAYPCRCCNGWHLTTVRGA